MRTLVLLFLLFVFFLSSAQQLETVIQKGHELAVLAVAVSPDSNYVATASRDKSAKLWEVHTGREVRSFLGHQASVTSVEFSSDGKYLVTGSNDKTARIWSVASGKMIAVMPSQDYITDVAIDPKLRFILFVGFNDVGGGGDLVVCDYKTQAVIQKIEVSPDKGLGSGVDLAFSPDGKWLAVGEDNRIVNVYETSAWQKIKTLAYPDGFCGGCGTRVEFSRDGKFLFVAEQNGALKKYEVPSYTIQHTYQEEIDDLTGLAVSADGKRVALSTETTVRVWDAGTGKLLATRQAEDGKFNEVTFSPSGETLMISADNNTASSWDYNGNKDAQVFTGFLNQRDAGGLLYDPNSYWQSNIARYVRFKNYLLISNDGKSLIKGKFDRKVKRWDIATGKTIMDFTGHKKAVLCYDLSKDGKKLLTGGGDGKIMLWDVASGDSLQSIEVYREPVFDIHFSADENKVLSSSWDGTMRIHDLQSGKLLTYIEMNNGSAYSLVYHPSELYAFTARLNNALEMWELDTKSVVRNFVGHTDIVSAIRLSKDNNVLLSSSWDGTIRLWNVGTGLMTKKLKDHQGAVHTAIFSPDETQIVSAGADRLIRVWDAATGKIVRTFEGHQAEVTSLLFSPDQKMLISHSVDGVTKFWDLNTGKEFFEHIHLGDKDWMVKNPEGYFTATDDARKYIHFVNGVKTYSVDQFFDEFYRPDLLPKIFQSRGRGDEGNGIQGKLKRSTPPSVKVAIVPASAPGKAEVYVRLKDNGSGTRNLRVQHNGKSIPLNVDALKYPDGGGTTTYQQTIDLVGGLNTITAVATNKENVESDAHSAEFFSEYAVKSSVCHILAVGINQYKNSRLNLNYARSDAESFSKILDEKSPALFKNVEVHTLYDKDATRNGILKALEDLVDKIHPEDVFIFYYAGHGSMVDNKFYFIPTESSRLYESSSLQKEAIEASLLQDKLKNIRALKQLIVMDACQSGGSVELLATRGASEEKAIAQLSRSAGIHVMASAGSEQFATEFTELGHGLFTYLLIQALQGAADGAPKDGKVTIYELKSFLDDQVPEMTRKLKGKPQYPYTFSRGQDFPVIVEE
jgi:WD40 repeat protein